MRFGPAGYPPGSKSPKDAMDTIVSLGLDALEVEFVRGVRVSEESARANGRLAAERDIRLSCHAPYFISFNSDKQETRDKSVQYVVDTARAAHWLGAYIIVIHAASYGKSPKTATDSVVDASRPWASTVSGGRWTRSPRSWTRWSSPLRCWTWPTPTPATAAA